MEHGNPTGSSEETFRLLLRKYKDGLCNEEEIAWLESWYLQWNEVDKAKLLRTELEEAKSLMWNAVQTEIQEVPVVRAKLWPKIAAAAAVLIVIGAGLFFYPVKNKNTAQTHIVYKNDVAPGGIKATLTLADGRKITLDGAKNGALAVQAGGIKITKAADGQLIYTIADSKSANPSAYNTIETPKGGQYQIRLPDGTQVWLNAASSMKYPLSFTNRKKRQVELTGEAYFEVSHNKLQPFVVKTTKQEVEVLGTHFDVNSYPDEAVTKTTLLEGSVRLNGGTVLKPGEQGLSKAGKIIVKQANLEEEMDWKNKQFILNEEDLQSVMRRIARWYDIEVVYQGTPSDVKFVGLVSSTRNISGVLKLMERTGKVHFKVEGKKITVLQQP